MQLGHTWTALIIVQVAIAVAVLPFAGYVAAQALLRGMARSAYPAHEILQARLTIEQEDDAAAPADGARFTELSGILLQRLETEPGVSGVTFASHFPEREPYGRVEIETGDAAMSDPASWSVRTNRVAVDMLPLFDVEPIAGRGFGEADAAPGATAVLINRAFAQRLDATGAVLGRRIRDVRRTPGGEPGELERGPWLEVVGVVPDFTVQSDFEPPNAKVYRAATAADMRGELSLVLRVRAGMTPAALATRVRSVAAAIDPALRLEDVRTAAEMQRQTQRGLQAIALGVVAVILSVLLLSAAGVYAMMSFTVARRRREIGIRAALGADPRRVLAGVFARAGAQLGAGVAAGLLLAAAFEWGSGGALGDRALILLPAVCALMVAVGLLAALGPARRSLNIQPTEALRAE